MNLINNATRTCALERHAVRGRHLRREHRDPTRLSIQTS